MKLETLANVCEINPKFNNGISQEEQCSFVPMEYVDDAFAEIRRFDTRRVAEVQKGYTPFRDGDVILAKITPCLENGKCALAKNLINGIGFGSTEFHVLRAGESVIPEWLYYFVRQQDVRDQLARRMHGSAGQQRVPSDAVEELLIPLPPLPEQRRIAALLDKADHLRRTRRYAAQLSETFLQAVFVRMFGDPVRNPMGWDGEVLESLADRIDYGVTASANSTPVGPKFLRITDIQNGMVNWVEVPYCQTSEEERRNSLLQDGDIVFARTGATTGKSFLIRKCPPNAVFASYLIRVRPNDKIDPVYLSGYFQSKAYWIQISENVVGSTQPGVNATKLGDLKIIIPPLALQQKFARIVQQFERLRAQQREAERQAEHLFQTLLHRAFRRGL